MASGVLLLGAAVLWRASKAPRWQCAGELIWQVPTSERIVALTFDDGPAPGYADEVLEALRARNARATFFVTGRGVETNRTDAAKILAAGHELANHSYSHQRMLFRSDEFIRREVEETDRLLRELGVKGEIFFRPPFGKKLFGLPRYLAAHQRKTITWSVVADGDPSRGRDPKSIADHVLANIHPGAIVLFHVLTPPRGAERQALPLVLERLADAGYQATTVAELRRHRPP